MLRNSGLRGKNLPVSIPLPKEEPRITKRLELQTKCHTVSLCKVRIQGPLTILTDMSSPTQPSFLGVRRSYPGRVLQFGSHLENFERYIFQVTRGYTPSFRRTLQLPG